DHIRHRRKYVQGELGADESFYFRGPAGQLNLRAQNLMLFIQLAEGIDDTTWMYHLRRSDYTRWFRDAIKDESLAAVTAGIEAQREITPAESRRLIKGAIQERYNLPVASSTPVRQGDAATTYRESSTSEAVHLPSPRGQGRYHARQGYAKAVPLQGATATTVAQQRV